MSYTITVKSDESIIWETRSAEFNPETEGDKATQAEIKSLNAASRPMVLIVDMRLMKLSWNDILYLSNYGIPKALKEHPRLCKIIIISTDEVVAESAKGLDRQPFGCLKLALVASPEEALTRVRRLLF